MNNARPRPVQFEQRGPGQRTKLGVKPKRWSHQDELHDARGKKIMVKALSGGTDLFELVDSDQFALRLRDPDDQSVMTIWKHAVAGYRIIEG